MIDVRLPMAKARAAALVLLVLLVLPVTLPHTAFKQIVLGNGLQVLLVENHDAPLVNVQVWYHVGSKNETPGRTGFAHFFEHLMFQGTKNIPPEDFSDYIIRSG